METTEQRTTRMVQQAKAAVRAAGLPHSDFDWHVTDDGLAVRQVFGGSNRVACIVPFTMGADGKADRACPPMVAS